MIRCLHLSLLLVAVAVLTPHAWSQDAKESKAAQATRMKLKEKISVDFKDIGTKAVFDDIKAEMSKGVNFKIDNVSGVSNNTKLTYQAKAKQVEDILNEMSDNFEFGWVVISNEANNKVDGWVIIRKNTKGKERGYELGKEPKGKGASLFVPLGDFVVESGRLEARRLET